ncbi:aspartate--tRNA ligase [Bacteroidetes bacterium endosymbiont of Geopemphigus sp.]|uniref:aspartate--tRNA ligase n=1 Tax=Bacteroidetes bacterium endosymbiont of Geopemphigus sp. TaxID=2047937 RepID=UPI000CD0EF36|nr:aspartate--tRNA ligase [Bacteroidetes bacterium endosymbiont of Geopemphigus sp.]
MYRTHHCGALRQEDIGREIVLSGWVHSIRNLGSVSFIDLRDRYGITQLTFYKENPLKKQADELAREFVIQISGNVVERTSKNPKNLTGDIEVAVSKLQVLNPSLIPPFTIEDQSDGNEELRMRYRYLDIRRNPIKDKLLLRHKIALASRKYLFEIDFIEVETPMLIKSTPEGARDFVVPSRMHPGQFYALPQSPQSFKQLLMIGGIDRYFQIVKCFRDEDFRADRQPEFTQIDCEMSFVEQEDILKLFEGLIVHLFREIRGIQLPSSFPRISYEEAMQTYGSDKPERRFQMTFGMLNELVKNKGFSIFDAQELIIGIAVPGCAEYTRKQLDELTTWVKRPQIGAQTLVWVKYLPQGDFKSSVDKYFDQKDLKEWAHKLKAQAGDLLLILSGKVKETQKQLGELRLEMGRRLGLLDSEKFAPLWVVDFPLLERSENNEHYHALHHPFTAPQEKDRSLMKSTPEKVRAQAYDLVINGSEIGGGSIRIHQSELQEQLFSLLGFSKEKAYEQFGFMINAFQYGAPPHGGIAFGLDRLAAVLAAEESIRDFIAFPKNNSGRDLMIQSPSRLDTVQLEELGLQIKTAL